MNEIIQNNIREKKHRLPRNFYRGRLIITFTLCINGRKNIFVEKYLIKKFVEMLLESIRKYDCRNWVYIFMPDHLHIVVEGKSKESDLWRTIVLFKQKTGFWLTRNKPGIKWQKDFYDHIHRKEDDLKRHIRYILDNPVRKGLVQNWEEYLFKGSLDFNLEEIIGWEYAG